MSTPQDNTVLRIIGGPASGEEHVLKKNEYTIGRTASASLVVPDIMISRNHARIYAENGDWHIQDLNSTNGTWIQGNRLNDIVPLPMKPAVRIGDTLFEVFRPEEEKKFDTSFISYRVAPITAESLASDTKSPIDQVMREQKRLAALYQLQSLLTSQSGESDLFNEILQIIAEVIPADRAYLLRYMSDQDHVIPVAEIDSNGPVEMISDTFISNSIVDYVKEHHEGVLSEDVLNDDRFTGESLCGFNVNTIMCAPMHGRQQLCGLIYMIGNQINHHFEQDDLMLLTSIAHAAGMAIENSKLVESNLKAERMAAVGMTAASLSHYIKNILGGLEGSVSLLRMGIDASDDSMMNEAWDTLDKNQKRLSSLMLDLLNLAKEDSIDLGIYDFCEVISEAVELVRPSAREYGIEIDFGSSGALQEPLLAEIDSRGIHRVILNLLRNAVDAVIERHHGTDQGRVSVEVKAENNGATLILTTVDNGHGIPSEQLDRIFEMFHTTKGDRGTGLGLAVSKRIVETHRGTLSVSSQVGVGTTFSVRLPTRQLDTSTSILDIMDL